MLEVYSIFTYMFPYINIYAECKGVFPSVSYHIVSCFSMKTTIFLRKGRQYLHAIDGYKLWKSFVVCSFNILHFAIVCYIDE